MKKIFSFSLNNANDAGRRRGCTHILFYNKAGYIVTSLAPEPKQTSGYERKGGSDCFKNLLCRHAYSYIFTSVKIFCFQLSSIGRKTIDRSSNMYDYVCRNQIRDDFSRVSIDDRSLY